MISRVGKRVVMVTFWFRNYLIIAAQALDGDQEYTVPAGTDLSQINSVVNYCVPFQVIISTAALG
jgi:hypothetical protein